MQGRLRQAAGALESHELALPSAGIRRADRRGGRGRPSAGFRRRPVRQRDRHRRVAVRRPVRQSRHHDQGDALRLRRRARPGGGAADAARFHRLPDAVRSGAAKLRRGILPARLRGRGAARISAQPFRIVDPGYAIKIFPAKFSTHYAITAALMARPQIPSARCDPRRAHHRGRRAVERPSASAQRSRRQVQPAIHRRRRAARRPCRPASFTDERLARADMQALLGKIEVRLVARHPEHLHGRPLSRPGGDARGRQGRRARAASGRADRGARRRSPTRSITPRRAIASRTYLAPDAVAACIARMRRDRQPRCAGRSRAAASGQHRQAKRHVADRQRRRRGRPDHEGLHRRSGARVRRRR